VSRIDMAHELLVLLEELVALHTLVELGLRRHNRFRKGYRIVPLDSR
jgi:hypothetical protein